MQQSVLTLSLAALLAAAATAADVTGKWSGNFELTAQDGSKETRPVFLLLKQEGMKLTGSGGPDPGEQYPILTGTIEGDTLKFTVEGGYQFDLKFTGDEILGDVRREQGGEVRHAKVSVRRTDR